MRHWTVVRNYLGDIVRFSLHLANRFPTQCALADHPVTGQSLMHFPESTELHRLLHLNNRQHIRDAVIVAMRYLLNWCLGAIVERSQRLSLVSRIPQGHKR